MSEPAGRSCFAVVFACSLSALAGCTGLVSKEPLFVPGSYNTSGLLLGHYRSLDESLRVVVIPGREGRVILLGFARKNAGQAAEDHSARDNQESLVQVLYAELAAIPLSGGDFALQLSCSASIEDGKIYASPLAGKKSPYRSFTQYGWVAQDRKKDHLWVSWDVGSFEDAVLDRYAVGTSHDHYGVRIIPPGLTGWRAKALFRDLIAQSMASGGSSQLYEKFDLNPQPTAPERAAIVLNDSEKCRTVQAEGEPPP